MTTPMTRQEFNSFFIEKTDIWNQATFEQMEFIQSIFALNS
jgi:hypothetical protein